MVPLTVRSHYSFLWGTASPERIVSAAKKMGYDRIAITDTDNLCGLWSFLGACKDHGVTPIVGAEITDPSDKYRAVCLVENEDGYRNLLRLITRRKTDKEFRLKTAMESLGRGMIILVRNADLLTDWHEAGLSLAVPMPRKPSLQSQPLFVAAKKIGVPIVATPGSFFLEPEEISTHRILRAIGLNSTISRLSPRDVAPVEAWLASPADYANRFSVCPETIHATHAIAERLHFTKPTFRWIMPPWENGTDKDAPEHLRRKAYKGAQKRYGQDLPEPVVERLEHELRVISGMNFASYFLVVKGIVDSSPRTCGRGSGAASLVSYCLGITNVCPIKHNLYFERFLNYGRKDPPDIDVDFAWDERDGILEKVLSDHAGRSAMVSSHILFQPRMAIRETAKVYGIPEGEFGRWVKRMGRYGWDEEHEDDLFSEAAKIAPDLPAPWPEILSFAQKLVGIPRYLSVHPGGVVITPCLIEDYAPVEKAPKGVPILQWEKDGTEDAGLVKIDLLGNRSLAVIRDAITNLRSNGNRFDEYAWKPEDDYETQESVAAGHTMGCFYIESPAMRLLQKKSQVGDFEHLVIHSSIIRPAANDCIKEYLRRLHGGDWEPLHPKLSDVLSETYGIMVYQEDVSRAAVAMAGFEASEAESLRKVMSRKDKSRVMEDFRIRFFKGSMDRGVTEDTIASTWEMMMSFSGYSFCKPHSASYAQVSFQAAWLKVHYPAELMSAVISNGGGFYGVFAYVSEARRMGLSILKPDVNQSGARWRGKCKEIRVGLSAVKGLSAATAERIVTERGNRHFSCIADFFERVRPDEDEAKALVFCGSLDSLHKGANRAQVLWEANVYHGSKKHARIKDSLFDFKPSDMSMPTIPEEDDLKRLRREFAVLGFLCDNHPMELFSSALKGYCLVKASNLEKWIGRKVTVAGWLITGKTVLTKHGDLMKFLTFEDETGTIETVLFPETYKRFFLTLDYNRPYVLKGKVEEEFGAVTLTVDTVFKPARSNCA